GSVLYIVWTGVMCIVVAVNAIVWNNNVDFDNIGLVWCDITSRLIIGGAVAIPAATLCINRRLHQILTLQYQRDHVVRNTLVDICIGLGIPGLTVVLYYVVQQYRSGIVEDVGCYPAIGNWKSSILLYDIWPLLITLGSSFYSGEWKRRHQKRFVSFYFIISLFFLYSFGSPRSSCPWGFP
ncbi:STE3-domain-containing protein, partial [Coniophora puteana RWD-64-598 SS2]